MSLSVSTAIIGVDSVALVEEDVRIASQCAPLKWIQSSTRPCPLCVRDCISAVVTCPLFPGQVERYHWPFEDPPKAAREGESEFDAFRRIRDQIHKVFVDYADGLKSKR